MHLKSLTLRGFKSFASTTTLHFEPGVTAVVGPNGAGKSNVVDAIAWVLGEQGAKSLRGGKMEDVIFAGTPGRPPLGRAEVLLTIDNADGALPIDYSEVTVSRLMYRSGASEYAINGAPCRLLDVQELLSDSGIGRELHVIVGQGQLDAVLHARPEERRAFIEEAAGVRKHLRRKEKALRKLDAMAANLARLTDLTAELRRQLGPLGRQAEVARRAAVVQAELRDARLRLLADDLHTLRESLHADVADENAARQRRAEVERALAAAVAAESQLEATAVSVAPELSAAVELWHRLATVAEQLRSTGRLAAERVRHLSAEPEPPRAGRDADALAGEAVTLAAEESELSSALDADRQRLAAAGGVRRDVEARLAAAEQRLLAAARAEADRREGLARLAGQVAAARSRRAAAAEAAERLTAAVAEAQVRRTKAEADFATLETEVAGLDQGEVGLDAEHEAATRALSEVAARRDALREEERALERERAVLTARRDALALGLDSRDGAAALLGGAPDGTGSRAWGRVASMVSVAPGAGTAIAAALGAVADGVVVADLDAAADAVTAIRAQDGGRVGLLAAAPAGPVPRRGPSSAGSVAVPGGPVPQRGPLLAGARWAADLVTAAEPVGGALDRLLHGVAVAVDLDSALRLLRDGFADRVVTVDGDVVTDASVTGGSAGPRSRIETEQAVAELTAGLGALEHRAERLRFQLARVTAEESAATARVEDALRRLHDSDARLAAVAERLGQLAAVARAAAAEVERLVEGQRRAEEARDRDDAALAALEARLTAASVAPEHGDGDPSERDRLAAAVADARAAEVDVQLAVRTGEERVRALAARIGALLAAAEAERVAAERAALARDRNRRQAARALAVSTAGAQLLPAVESALQEAVRRRATAETDRAALDRDLAAARARVRELTTEHELLTDAVHRDEVMRTQLRLRIEAIEQRAAEEYAVPAESLLADYGPQVPVPAIAVGEGPTGDDVPVAAVPYDRAAQEQRAEKAERALVRLGRVNPLALEEYAALEERHAYLVSQLEDLKGTRRDLLTVIHEVDERVEEVFAAAFADTAREFEGVFATLFPGGSGQLLLTDPGSLLTSGVEVMARPAGKKVSRLSLLSGGERSLTAIALLVAIFRARPSPFYILDEVEAALDDRNLGRLVGLFADLRGTSQLLVITHQKRTMEAADALYGVTMRDDGVSTVISQRLREPVAVPA